MPRRAHGFTLVELVVVIVLLGIISAYVAPRFYNGRGGFAELTAQQELKQAIRFAQQLAMSRTGDTITFVINSNQIDILDNGISISNNFPQYPITLPSETTTNNLTLTFDRFGWTGNSATQTIVLTSATQPMNVCIEGTTSYAHDC